MGNDYMNFTVEEVEGGWLIDWLLDGTRHKTVVQTRAMAAHYIIKKLTLIMKEDD